MKRFLRPPSTAPAKLAAIARQPASAMSGVAGGGWRCGRPGVVRSYQSPSRRWAGRCRGAWAHVCRLTRLSKFPHATRSGSEVALNSNRGSRSGGRSRGFNWRIAFFVTGTSHGGPFEVRSSGCRRDGARAIHRAVSPHAEVSASRGNGATLTSPADAAGLPHPRRTASSSPHRRRPVGARSRGPPYRLGPLLYGSAGRRPRVEARRCAARRSIAWPTRATAYLNAASATTRFADRREGIFDSRPARGCRQPPPAGVGSGALAVLRTCPPRRWMP